MKYPLLQAIIFHPTTYRGNAFKCRAAIEISHLLSTTFVSSAGRIFPAAAGRPTPPPSTSLLVGFESLLLSPSSLLMGLPTSNSGRRSESGRRQLRDSIPSATSFIST